MSEKSLFRKMFAARGEKVGETGGEKLVKQLEKTGDVDSVESKEMAQKLDLLDRLVGKLRKDEFEEGFTEFKLEFQNTSSEEKSAWLFAINTREVRAKERNSFITKQILPDLPERLARLREWAAENR